MKYILTPANHRTEDIRIGAIVVAELKFRHVQRQVFGADFVEGADHAALEDAPKALDCIGVDRADNVLTKMVRNRAARIFGQAASRTTTSCGR